MKLYTALSTWWSLRGILIVYGLAVFSGVLTAAPTSCIQCHGDYEWIQDEKSVEIVKHFEEDVHNSVGLSCQDCHGGNPDPALGEEVFEAMDENFEKNPYKGAIERKEIPEFCGKCHSDPEYMRRFQPDARVDQVTEYWTSKHGIRLKEGDEKVATCIDCHPAHRTRRPSDPQSQVYHTKVAETCSSCHSDADRMSGYNLESGKPLPTDQYARWSQSVHADALLEREDLSAPTCNDCHGNHGATPPNLSSVSFVCGQCHGREASLFRDSPKLTALKEHNESYLSLMGDGGCAECHEPPEPSAAVTDIYRFTQCGTCHGNHAIVSPRITMLAPLPDTPCAYCHEGVGKLATEFKESEEVRAHYQRVRDELLAEAEQKGITGNARFDWLLDQAQKLEPHQSGEPSSQGAEADSGFALSPEFSRLRQKFRIGKTHFTYEDPATGEEKEEALMQCVTCHSSDSDGYKLSQQVSNDMHQLAALTASADRILLAAKRGGVRVEDQFSMLEQALEGQIQLQVLLHSFVIGEDTEFSTQREEAIKNARDAIAAGNKALEELRFRRTGLFVSLGIILLLLCALGLKIRDISRRNYS